MTVLGAFFLGVLAGAAILLALGVIALMIIVSIADASPSVEIDKRV